jgi:hypothetical protein
MKRRILSLFILILSGPIFFGEQQLLAQHMEEEIRGNWLMESNGDQFIGGNILFKNDVTYSFYKKFADGTGAELSGGYSLSAENKPAQLKLCLGDCNAADSEWTTSFCILRLNQECKLELYISSAGNYPDAFPADLNAPGMYVFVRDQ